MEVQINSGALILCLIGLVVSVVLNLKKNYPLGLMALIFALVIGVGYMGMSINAIIASFPTSTVLALLLAVPFFGMLSSTGMLTILGKRMLRLVKGDVRLLPLIAIPAIALVAFAAATQIPFVFGPILIGIASAGGMDLMIIVLVMAFAVPIGSCNPWTSFTGQTIAGLARDGGLPNPTGIGVAVWINAIIAFLSIMLVAYFFYKGHKAQKVDVTAGEVLTMNKQQKQALVIFVTVIALFLIPALLTKFFPRVMFMKKVSALCNNNIIFSVGILVCVILGFDSFEGAMKKVPMTLVFMLVGIVMLLQVANAAGFSELVSGLISESVPTFLIPAVFTLVACIMSFFATFFAVLPVLWTIAVPVAAATGLSPALLLTCIVVGAIGSGSASPLSSGGAANLSVFPADVQPDMSKKMLAFALFSCVWFTLLALVGVFNIGPMLVGV